MDSIESAAPPASPEPKAADGILSEEVFVFPTTEAQRRFWLLDQLKPGNPALNVPLAARLTGRLDRPILERTVNEILRRHEILRTSFRSLDHEVVQIIHPEKIITLDSHDITGLPDSEREARVHQLMLEEGARPFVLSEAPLFRGSLIKVREEEQVLMLTLHHIGCDGWSNGIVMREVAEIYSALIEGRPGLPELPLQYADFAQWQQQWLESPPAAEQRQFWTSLLHGVLPVMNLPTDRPRAAHPSQPGTIHTLLLPRTLTEAIKDFCKREDVTPFMLFLAVYATLLYRYTGNPDIVVGSPAANRSQTDIEGLIGLFSNPLVMRQDLSGNPSLRLLLQRVKDLSVGAFAHQSYPFEKLLEEIQTDSQRAGLQWLQAYFIFQKAFMVPQQMPELTLNPLRSISPGAMFEWCLGVLERAEGIRLQLEYNSDLYDQTTIDRMLHHFQQVLETALTGLDVRIDEIPILTPAEQDKLLIRWNKPKLETPRSHLVHELFEQQAHQIPDAPAVCDSGTQLSYSQLNHRANQVAHYLRRRGVGPESRVGLAIDARTIEFIVGFLGILKAGGCCVILDSQITDAAVARLIHESRPVILLTKSGFTADDAPPGPQIVCFDTDANAIAREPNDNLPNIVLADQPACVRFTSARTTTPAGAVLSHGALLNSAWVAKVELDLKNQDRVGFTLDEMLPALVAGAALVLPLHLERFQAGDWLDWVRLLGVTVAAVPTRCWHEIVQAFPVSGERSVDLRLLAIGGARMSSAAWSLWRRVTAGRVRLLDRYLLSETVGAVGYSEPNPDFESLGQVFIARPALNSRIYVLDASLQPVPVGVPGDIYVGGQSLASGFLPESGPAAHRLVPDRISNKAGETLFRTGDRGRFLAGGGLEFVGRSDDLANTNGFRLELAEIWSVLCQHPAVWDALILPHENSGKRSLIAYVVSKSEQFLDEAVFRDFVRERLPDYMVPAAFVILERFPLTASGKLDREALPLPNPEPPGSESKHVAPETPTERLLCGIWGEVLGLRQVGITDNFFDLGGQSLLALRLQARVEKALGQSVSLAAFFKAPTVREFAGLIRDPAAAAQQLVLLTPHSPTDKPPLFCLHFLSSARSLAKHLKPDRAVYGIQSPIDEELRQWHEQRQLSISMEQLAERCLAIIRGVQPGGPYYLLGFCFGGRLALEVARQLLLFGEEVALLALVDAAYSPGCRPLSMPWLKRWTYHASQVLTHGPSHLSTRARARQTSATRRRSALQGMRNGHSSPGDGEPNLVLLPQAEFLSQITKCHVQETYLGDAVLIRATAEPSFAFDLGAANGWDSVVQGNLQIEDLACSHTQIAREPHVTEVAGWLDRHLSQADAKSAIRATASGNPPSSWPLGR
jgi:non-ribosomal peptide synthetase component F/thioesterase domain-containing protein